MYVIKISADKILQQQQQLPVSPLRPVQAKNPPSAQDLLPILFGLLENADHVRRSAEDALDDIKSQYPDAALRGVTQIAVEGPEALRQFAMVLLRRMLSRTSCFFRARTGAETRSMVKSTLLTALEAGVQVRIRRAAVHCIVELAAALSFSNDEEARGLGEVWPELLAMIPALCQHTDARCRDSGFELLRHLSEAVPSTMYQPSFLQPMYQILCGGLRDGDAQVRLSAFQCIAQFITALEAPHARAPFQEVVPQLLHILAEILSQGDEAAAKESLESLVSVAESQPTFWKPHLPEVWQAMCTVMQTQALDDGSRTTAMEFILALCESRPTMVRKRGDLLEHLLDTCFPALCEVEEMDTESWASAPENDDTYGDVEDTDAFCNAIEQALTGLRQPLADKPCLQCCCHDAEPSWRDRSGMAAAARRPRRPGSLYRRMQRPISATSGATYSACRSPTHGCARARTLCSHSLPRTICGRPRTEPSGATWQHRGAIALLELGRSKCSVRAAAALGCRCSLQRVQP